MRLLTVDSQVDQLLYHIKTLLLYKIRDIGFGQLFDSFYGREKTIIR